MSEQYQKVRVLDDPYWVGCDTISAKYNGEDIGVTYDEVASAFGIVPSDRDDGLETLVLADGRHVVVQSIDLDYGGAE